MISNVAHLRTEEGVGVGGGGWGFLHLWAICRAPVFNSIYVLKKILFHRSFIIINIYKNINKSPSQCLKHPSELGN